MINKFTVFFSQYVRYSKSLGTYRTPLVNARYCIMIFNDFKAKRPEDKSRDLDGRVRVHLPDCNVTGRLSYADFFVLSCMLRTSSFPPFMSCFVLSYFFSSVFHFSFIAFLHLISSFLRLLGPASRYSRNGAENDVKLNSLTHSLTLFSYFCNSHLMRSITDY